MTEESRSAKHASRRSTSARHGSIRMILLCLCSQDLFSLFFSFFHISSRAIDPLIPTIDAFTGAILVAHSPLPYHAQSSINRRIPSRDKSAMNEPPACECTRVLFLLLSFDVASLFSSSIRLPPSIFATANDNARPRFRALDTRDRCARTILVSRFPKKYFHSRIYFKIFVRSRQRERERERERERGR